MKSSTHVISQRAFRELFHSNKYNYVEKKIVENLFPFEKYQELCLRLLYQISFYVCLSRQ
jgi:hypothetical protein